MRLLLTLVAYCAAFVVVAVLAVVLVLLLAGPHAGLLPQPAETGVLLLGWLALLGGPLWVARRVWKRLAKRRGG